MKPDEAARKNLPEFGQALGGCHVVGVERVRHVHRRNRLRDWIPLTSTHGAGDPSQSDGF
jgi:hypothetical protein